MRTRDENKEKAILREALHMIVKEGFDGLSMQKVAKAAGVSPATIYIYFKDRDDLIIQLYARIMEKYFRFILQDFDPESSFAEGMRVQWKRRVQFALEHKEVGLFMEHITYTPLHLRAQAVINPEFRNMMTRFSEKAVANGELRKMPSFEVYWSIAFAPLMQLIKSHQVGYTHKGEPFELTDEILYTTLDMVLKALKP